MSNLWLTVIPGEGAITEAEVIIQENGTKSLIQEISLKFLLCI